MGSEWGKYLGGWEDGSKGGGLNKKKLDEEGRGWRWYFLLGLGFM